MRNSFPAIPAAATSTEPECASATRVDTHAHYYEDFPRNLFLDTAAHRLAPHPDSPPGIVLLAEPDSARHPLSRIGSAESSLRNWTLHALDDECVLRCDREGQPKLFLIAARQLTSAEGLEVLALCCAHAFSPGQPLENLLHEIDAQGGLGVITWGFGKWWGRRGRLLGNLFAQDARPPFLLGDTGGRPHGPWFASRFHQAAGANVRCVAGSDPLPWASQAERVGRYAIELQGSVDREAPVSWLRQRLIELTVDPPRCGQRGSWWCCLQDQLTLRMKT